SVPWPALRSARPFRLPARLGGGDRSPSGFAHGLPLAGSGETGADGLAPGGDVLAGRRLDRAGGGRAGAAAGGLSDCRPAARLRSRSGSAPAPRSLSGRSGRLAVRPLGAPPAAGRLVRLARLDRGAGVLRGVLQRRHGSTPGPAAALPRLYPLAPAAGRTRSGGVLAARAGRLRRSDSAPRRPRSRNGRTARVRPGRPRASGAVDGGAGRAGAPPSADVEHPGP